MEVCNEIYRLEGTKGSKGMERESRGTAYASLQEISKKPTEELISLAKKDKDKDKDNPDPSGSPDPSGLSGPEII